MCGGLATKNHRHKNESKFAKSAFYAVKNSNSVADDQVKNDNSREFISYVKFLSSS